MYACIYVCEKSEQRTAKQGKIIVYSAPNSQNEVVLTEDFSLQ